MPPTPPSVRGTASSKGEIIDAAERLFGQRGVDGVSLRQIATAAGSHNHFAVQYHFRDKQGLIRAIFERRLAELELRRAAMLAAATRDGATEDVRRLTEIILRPIADLRDLEGRRSYASFVLALHHATSSFHFRVQMNDLAPVTEQITDMLAAAVPHAPREVFVARMNALTASFLFSLLDGAQPPGLTDAIGVEDALDVVAAGLSAPFRGG